MRRTNRIEPWNIDPKYLASAFMITTTQLEIVRRVEITPIVESEAVRVGTPIERSSVSTPIKPSWKILWCIGCLFFTAGILVLLIMITGLTVIFRRVNTMKQNNIERYDLGDLQYGISNVYHPSNISLSNANKAAVQKYLFDQLRNQPGFRGLTVEDIFVQANPVPKQRKPRDTSCSIRFIIQNTQVYFDHCSTCINNRNIILHRLLFNRTAFREPFHLILNNQHLLAQICSTPNKSQLIIPKQIDSFEVENPLKPPMDSFEISTTASTGTTTSFTSRNSIRTEETSSRKTTGDIFQFSPYRPSTRKFER